MAMLSPRRLTCSRVVASILPGTLLLAPRSSLSQHKVLSLAWSHLAACSPCGQLADEEVGLLVHHWFDVYLLYALVGSVTSHADAVTVL